MRISTATSNGFLYAASVLLWGSTWIAIEYQLGTVAPVVSVFYRYVLASTVLFAWAAIRRLPLRFGVAAHGRFILLGLMLFSMNYILTYSSQQYITSALAAIAFSTMLWMNMLNARIVFGSRVGWRVLAGSLLGVGGIVILFVPEVQALSLEDTTLLGMGMAVTAAYIASLGNMVSQDAQHAGLPVIQSNAWGMLYGALITGAIAHFQGHPFNFDWSAPYLVSLTYLAIFGSVAAFGAYLTLLGRIGAARAGYAMVMFPVVAVVISLAVGEIAPSPHIFIGGLIVIGGNLLVARARQVAAGPAAGNGKEYSRSASGSVAGRFWRYAPQKPR